MQDIRHKNARYGRIKRPESNYEALCSRAFPKACGSNFSGFAFIPLFIMLHSPIKPSGLCTKLKRFTKRVVQFFLNFLLARVSERVWFGFFSVALCVKSVHLCVTTSIASPAHRSILALSHERFSPCPVLIFKKLAAQSLRNYQAPTANS